MKSIIIAIYSLLNLLVLIFRLLFFLIQSNHPRKLK